MQTKLKIILVTVVCTTIGWVVIIAGLLFLWPSTGPAAIVQLPRPGDPSLVEWQSQSGEFIIRLVSSNIATSATSVLFSRTSRPPERIWFEILKAQPPKDK
jgi:hypothetical protein